MNILLCPNNYYTMPAMALLASIFKYNKCELNFYIIHSDLSEKNVKKIEKFVLKNGAAIKFYKIKTSDLGDLPVSNHITVETYYRLLAFELLPKNLDRVFYLDSDIIVHGSLEAFYNTSFSMDDGKEAMFIACEGPGVSQRDFSVYDSLNIPHDKLYCNGGVMMMNLNAMRKELTKNSFWEFIAEHHNVLKYHDQDTINAMFYDRIKYLDWHIWNQTILHIKDRNEAIYRLQNSIILHYAGVDKPWKVNYKSWWLREFWNHMKIVDKVGFYKFAVKRIIWQTFHKNELPR